MKRYIVAFKGLYLFFCEEKNAKTHLAVSLLVIATSSFLEINNTEWLLVLVCFALVFCTEIINSSIERICDMVRPERSEKVKDIKDMAAGAVLAAAIISSIIGLGIFIPYILKHMHYFL
jgi:diacylglycerol kinase